MDQEKTFEEKCKEIINNVIQNIVDHEIKEFSAYYKLLDKNIKADYKLLSSMIEKNLEDILFLLFPKSLIKLIDVNLEIDTNNIIKKFNINLQINEIGINDVQVDVQKLFNEIFGINTGNLFDLYNQQKNTPCEIRICKDCHKEFIIELNEKQFFESKKLSLPVRCKSCREKRKLIKENNDK
jgi:DNA-directed RNA polymerase subunit RPC12/RpoP